MNTTLVIKSNLGHCAFYQSNDSFSVVIDEVKKSFSKTMKTFNNTPECMLKAIANFKKALSLKQTVGFDYDTDYIVCVDFNICEAIGYGGYVFSLKHNEYDENDFDVLYLTCFCQLTRIENAIAIKHNIQQLSKEQLDKLLINDTLDMICELELNKSIALETIKICLDKSGEIFFKDGKNWDVIRPVSQEQLRYLQTEPESIKDVWKMAVHDDYTELGLADFFDCELRNSYSIFSDNSDEAFPYKDESDCDKLTKEIRYICEKKLYELGFDKIGTWECAGTYAPKIEDIILAIE